MLKSRHQGTPGTPPLRPANSHTDTHPAQTPDLSHSVHRAQTAAPENPVQSRRSTPAHFARGPPTPSHTPCHPSPQRDSPPGADSLPSAPLHAEPTDYSDSQALGLRPVRAPRRPRSSPQESESPPVPAGLTPRKREPLLPSLRAA